MSLTVPVEFDRQQLVRRNGDRSAFKSGASPRVTWIKGCGGFVTPRSSSSHYVLRTCIPLLALWGGGSKSVHRRAAITIVLLAVLALRSLLPAGYMLQSASAAEGLGLEIVICASSGARLLAVDDENKPVSPKPQHADTALCPYAASGAAAVAAAESKPVVCQVEYAAVTYTLAVALFAETPKPGAVSARGPPLSALI